MKNASFTAYDVARTCERKLGISFRDGAEMNGWFEHSGRRIARITVPRGRKYIPPKTYASMARQLKLPVTDFDGLLECPFGLADYLETLRKLGLI